jgi:hypothetical protein
MVDALKLYVVRAEQYADVVPGELAIRFEHYWEAILSCYPKARDNPKDYCIQKGVGLPAFTMAFPKVDGSTSDKSADGYRKVLKTKGSLPNSKYWGKKGSAYSIGTSFTNRKNVSARIWP